MEHRDRDLTDVRGQPILRFVVLLSVALGGGALLALGLFLWVGSWQLTAMGFDDPVILFWDSLLCVFFFLQHSGMIRRGFRRRLTLIVPSHLDGAVFSIASGAMLAVVLGLWQRSPVEILTLGSPWSWVLRAGYFLAIMGFGWGVRALHGFDGFGLRPIRDLNRGRVRRDPPLAVSGPYRWVRHPLYSCVLLMVWSCPDVTSDRLLFNLLWTAWIVVGTVFEERDLIADFGDDYRAYQAAVPMLIPWTLRPRWPVIPR